MSYINGIEKEQKMSLEHGILGFLAIKPLSGYDIKKLFAISASYFWPADQAQIYRSLKKLVEDGSAELKECSRGMTVDRKVYEITDKGHERLYAWVTNPSIYDFVSRLPQIMQLFFSGGLSREEQLRFLDRQLKINNGLIQKLKDNYEENGDLFAEVAGLSEGDRRFDSATYACRWGILRGEAYAQLLEEIKEEILKQGN
jgi:DNA-binding PadR family transcriptional regulator